MGRSVKNESASQRLSKSKSAKPKKNLALRSTAKQASSRAYRRVHKASRCASLNIRRAILGVLRVVVWAEIPRCIEL